MLKIWIIFLLGLKLATATAERAVIPASAAFIAKYAEINSNLTVKQQWQIEEIVLRESWDRPSNSRAREWVYKDRGVRFGYATKDGKKTQYYIGRCVTVKDTRDKWAEINDYFGSFSEYVGLVADPFLETTDQYELWQHPTSGNGYLFLHRTTRKVVFLQDFWEEIKKHVALWFEGGLSETSGVSVN